MQMGGNLRVPKAPGNGSLRHRVAILVKIEVIEDANQNRYAVPALERRPRVLPVVAPNDGFVVRRFGVKFMDVLLGPQYVMLFRRKLTIVAPWTAIYAICLWRMSPNLTAKPYTVRG